MEGWVGLVGSPIADTLPTKWSDVNHRSGKVRRSNHWATLANSNAIINNQSHVRQTVLRCFTVFRQLRTVRRQVPTSVFQSLIVALVLGYCNSVLFGLPVNLIRRLQSVQNAAAPLTFRIRRSEHITPALISLHWLRVPERISFKLAVMTYWPRRPTYSHVSPVLPTWHPDDGCGLLPRIVWTFRPFVSTVGRRASPVSGAAIWNDLPLHIASAPALAVFWQRDTIIRLVLLLPFITTVWTAVVLAIINII